MNYSGTQAPPHALSVQFDATPSTLHFSPAKIQSGNSQLVLIATVNNYNSPVVQTEYNATVDGQQLAGILHEPSIPSGLVVVSGTAQYQATTGRTFVQSLVVNGDVNSRVLIAKTPTMRAEVSNIAGHYSLSNGDATLRDFRASLLGGEVTAQGTMKNVGGDSRSKIDATLRGISLANAKRLMGAAASTGPVAIAGTLNATATATWSKSFDDLVAHTDATIHANVDKAHSPQRGAAAGSITGNSTVIAARSRQRRTSCNIHGQEPGVGRRP